MVSIMSLATSPLGGPRIINLIRWIHNKHFMTIFCSNKFLPPFCDIDHLWMLITALVLLTHVTEATWILTRRHCDVRDVGGAAGLVRDKGEWERKRVSIIYSSKEGAGSPIPTDPTGVNFIHKEVQGVVDGQSCTAGVRKSGCYTMVHIKIHENGFNLSHFYSLRFSAKFCAKVITRFVKSVRVSIRLSVCLLSRLSFRLSVHVE